MNTEERNKLLIQIEQKLDNLIKAFDKVSNGTGFPRCVERLERVKRLEHDVIEIKTRKVQFDTWLMRTTWVVIIAGVVKIAFF
jgi:hypothetical protein